MLYGLDLTLSSWDDLSTFYPGLETDVGSPNATFDQMTYTFAPPSGIGNGDMIYSDGGTAPGADGVLQLTWYPAAGGAGIASGTMLFNVGPHQVIVMQEIISVPPFVPGNFFTIEIDASSNYAP